MSDDPRSVSDDRRPVSDDRRSISDDRRSISDDRRRTRLVWTLFVANAMSSTAFIAAVTVASLVAADLAGSARLAGLPATLGTLGTAAGAWVLGAVGARVGRRPSFVAGFTVAALGALVAVAGAVAGSFVGFALGMAVLGFGRSAAQLARYAAGDLRTPERRGRAISIVVWAATIGAVLGPQLVPVAADLAASVGLPADGGPLVFAAAVYGGGALLLALALRPEPATLAVREPTVPGAPPVPADAPPMRVLLGRPTVLLSIVVLATSQLVMVMVMTMTPVHVRAVGGGLDVVGDVMSGHTLGMFALAPVTGWLVDRIGPRPVMATGAAVLVASCGAAALAHGTDGYVLHAALVGLGFGWNLGFVSASSHLQVGLAAAERARVQGAADAVTWTAGALGAGVSGVVVAAASYEVLALAGAVAAVVVPVGLVLLRRPTPA